MQGRPSLRRRVTVLVVCYLGLFLLLTAAVLPPLLRVHDDLVHQRTVLAPANAAITSLTQAAIDQETGERGFLLTGTDAFLAPYNHGRAAARKSIAMLRSSPIASLKAPLAKVVADLTVWQQKTAIPQIDARRRTGALPSHAELAQQEHRGTGRFNQVRADLGALSNALSGDIDDTRSELRFATNLLIISVIVGALAAVALTVVAFAQLRKWLTRPIGELLAALRRVGEGDFDESVPQVGASEIAEIGASADDMRRRIVSELEAVTRGEQALEQRGPVVLLLRDELEPTPVEIPVGLDVGARFEAAEGLLAGDFYDLTPVPGGGIGLVIADVSGHGPAAGLMAVRVKYLVAAALEMGMAPDRALEWVARRLGRTEDLFATCVIAHIEPGFEQLVYASAGHPPLLVVTPDTITEHGPTGPLLGPFPGSWSARTLPLGPDTMIVAYTDGVIEARSPQGELFGTDRLCRELRSAGDAPADEVAAAVQTAVRDFIGAPAADDLTLAVVRVTERTRIVTL
jgi:sigma-B regulation protein RsbU (phosphoserine phosphatase)